MPANRPFAQRRGLPDAPEPLDPATLSAAVRATLIYSDLFDSPLRLHETHRYLVAAAPLREVGQALEREAASGFIERSGPWHYLAGRGEIMAKREQRAAVAQRRWAQARRYGAVLAALPYVRMVAVTGSLAVENAGPEEDIDWLIVTAPGRLWFSRAMAVALVRIAQALSRVTLCPNYLISTERLEIGPQDFFSAHEFAQMVPLAGGETYRRLLRRNAWVAGHLPNAFLPLVQAAQLLPEIGSGGQRLMEQAGGGALGGLLEDWERRRKVRRLLERAGREGGRVAFTPDECRGHFGDRAAQIAAAYRDRLARYSVPPPASFARSNQLSVFSFQELPHGPLRPTSPEN